MKGIAVRALDANGYYLFDTLVERQREKKFPYDMRDAFIPQKVIPSQMRSDTFVLACFYFYVCLYMRGGIKSLQAFAAMLRMYHDHPKLFDPAYAQYLQPAELQLVIAKYVGWDAKAVAGFWIENSKRLVRKWNGDPRNIVKGLDNYEEALRRIQNKATASRKVREEADAIYGNGLGFMGFQPKMVSMFIYFMDWDNLLPIKFLYPAPADFHNFRLALSHQALVLDPMPITYRVNEALSVAWRNMMMRYLKDRGNVTPVELADALWLFSLVLCGESPLTMYKEPQVIEGQLGPANDPGDELFPHDKTMMHFSSKRRRNDLKRTCLACPILNTCTLAIPAAPYYQRKDGREGAWGGQLLLQARPVIESTYKPMPVKFSGWTGKSVVEELYELFDE